jgi:hypothetical protein
MPGCSFIKWFGLKDWFDNRFRDLCDEHDTYYVKRIWQDKVYSDFHFCARMAARGYMTLAFFSFIFFCTIGTTFWLWKKYVVAYFRN